MTRVFTYALVLMLGAVGGALSQIPSSFNWNTNGTNGTFQTGLIMQWAAPQHVFSSQDGTRSIVLIGHDTYFSGLAGTAGTLKVDVNGKLSVVP